MPAKSKQQFKFMQAVAHGSIKKKGLSKAKAKEYVSGQSFKGLPVRVAKKRKKKLKGDTKCQKQKRKK